jgi:hypothetical protein
MRHVEQAELGSTVDMMVEGWLTSRVPRRTFCSISVSSPSWLEP